MIQQENIITRMHEYLELVHENGQEFFGANYNPDFTSLINFAIAGLLRVFALRINKVLVGYAIFIVSGRLFERDVYAAECISIYVRKQYRGHSSIKLIRAAEKELGAEGIQSVQYKVPESQRRMFEHLGYGLLECTLIKEM